MINSFFIIIFIFFDVLFRLFDKMSNMFNPELSLEKISNGRH